MNTPLLTSDWIDAFPEKNYTLNCNQYLLKTSLIYQNTKENKEHFTKEAKIVAYTDDSNVGLSGEVSSNKENQHQECKDLPVDNF